MERPKRTDTEDDVLEMQKQFLSLKSKGDAFKPAAQVVKVEKEKKQSLFAQKRRKNESVESKSNSEPPLKSCALGEIIEKKLPTTIVSYNFVIGDIIEKPSVIPMEVKECTDKLISFPEVEKLESFNMTRIAGKSLFAQSMELKNKKITNTITRGDLKTSTNNISIDLFGNKSIIIKDEVSAKSIHEENVNLLSHMTEAEILKERANLMKCIDSKVLDFIKTQKNKLNPDVNACVEAVTNVMKTTTDSVEMEDSEKLQISFDKFSTNNQINKESSQAKGDIMEVDEIPIVLDIIYASESENWINFNIIEKDKLEWMKEIPNMIANIKPGEPFEARFDWKGILLPYIQKENKEDDRELYMHGDEPFRPGYTLQELFRLARASVMQQRFSAFGCIYGILSIYNQGFYDNVLELPITKIFFLLRYGMDENAIAQLEIVSKALATLFYNETDEAVLDFIFETSEGFLQPVIESNKATGDSDTGENIEKHLKNMTLSQTPFCVKLDEEEYEGKALMTDFELAENDLIDCFLRTNIIQRIYFILKTIKPENSTVISCLKILIRLARTNKEIAKIIVSHEELMQVLIENFLPGLQKIDLQADSKFYNYPQYIVLKLFRIIMSQNLSLCIKLLSFNFIDIIKNYLYTREDIKGQIIKVQIECFRIIRVLMHIKPDLGLYKSLLPAFRYMLEWHYQHVVYEEGGPFLIRQHASALLGAITSGPSHEAKNILSETIEMCCSKWFHSAKQNGIKEFSQSNLLSSCINCVNWYLKYNEAGFEEFIEKYLKTFISSKGFIEYQSTLESSSIILKYDAKDRRNIHPPLSNLGTVLINSNGPQLIISQCYSIYMLNSILKLTETLVMKKRKDSLMLSLLQVDMIKVLVNYLKKISNKVNMKLSTNFIMKSELKLIYKLICFEGFHEFLTKAELLQASFNLISCMSSEHIQEIEILFKTVLFNSNYLEFEENKLENWRQIYLETFIYPHSISISPTEVSLSLPCFPEPILPTDWPYMLLKSLLNKYLQMNSKAIVEKEAEFPESEIISITLTFTSLLERNGLQITSATEKLMYLMIAFMGPDAVFLESNMKSLLKEHIDYFFKMNRDTNFNFGGTFEGKSKFENLYVLFLDHFQAASYGDALFSSLVMVPLAQIYDSKWRKMVWSEHASVLRFLNCEDNQLLGSLQAYLEPEETDISLIKCYARSINLNLLRENTIPYKIATYHLDRYRMKNKDLN